MKNYVDLNKEYDLFKIKVIKASKDFSDAIKELSPENYNRFKKELKEVLPIAFTNLINELNKYFIVDIFMNIHFIFIKIPIKWEKISFESWFFEFLEYNIIER